MHQVQLNIFQHH